ncbi:Error-prone repair protein ImuA [Pedobacter kyungheensis]|uniref:Error-prone repair protein ImuA n=1 Tax=Pedobacter kyungheensis TaxID=1069985 RepID=A0A0C1DE84_9SPHI|nr:Error-prone repair protein ImuA [Pedobacter kyungheensis]KIA92255.1 Error-prone repair protein ImuA [Pedobacter kyungheensis]
MESESELIAKLQQDILLWQGFKPVSASKAERIGLGAIEDAFPGGVFPKRAIHEFISVFPEDAAASDGFIAGILSSLMQDGAACAWISTKRRLFPASLRSFNVEPERIIFMDAKSEKDALWIMEEALRCQGLAAVVAELDTLSLIESRRLQLAVEESGVTGFILRKSAGKTATTIATARWQISPIASVAEQGMPGLGFPRWNVNLLKVRNGIPGNWILEWAGEGFLEIKRVLQSDGWKEEQNRQIG